MATMIPGHRTILSVSPIESSLTLNHNGFKDYTHPPAPRDEILIRTFIPQSGKWCRNHPDGTLKPKDIERGFCPTCKNDLEEIPQWMDQRIACDKGKGFMLLRIYDTQQWTADFNSDKENYIPRPVECQVVCRDLIKHWSNDLPGAEEGCKPGMLLIAGDEPTLEELEQVGLASTEYYRKKFDEATALFADGKSSEINALHRICTRALGREDLPWLQKVEIRAPKRCPNCDETISVNALGCRHCQIFLPDWYKKANIEVTREIDPAVVAYLEHKAPKPLPPPDKLKVQAAPQTVNV